MVHLLEVLFSKCRFYSKIFHLNDRYLFHFICNSILSLTFIKKKKSSLLFRVAVKVKKTVTCTQNGNRSISQRH